MHTRAFCASCSWKKVPDSTLFLSSYYLGTVSVKTAKTPWINKWTPPSGIVESEMKCVKVSHCSHCQTFKCDYLTTSATRISAFLVPARAGTRHWFIFLCLRLSFCSSRTASDKTCSERQVYLVVFIIKLWHTSACLLLCDC